MRLNFKPAFQVFCHPDCFSTSGTESVGLAADARGVMVFAMPSRLFHRDPKLTILTRTWYRQDSFIVTHNFSAICRDWQKPRAPRPFALPTGGSGQAPTAPNQTAGPLGLNYWLPAHKDNI